VAEARSLHIRGELKQHPVINKTTTNRIIPFILSLYLQYVKKSLTLCLLSTHGGRDILRILPVHFESVYTHKLGIESNSDRM
jgi:hypothetical protein